MERILIRDLHDHINAEVTIQGWVDVARNQGKVAFFDFRDRSGKIQGVVFGKPEILEIAKELKPEWVVSVHGKVNQRPEKMVNEEAENGDIELEITDLTVLSPAAALPFDLDTDLNLETLLNYRPLTLRRDNERAIFKIQHEILRAYRHFLSNEDFIEIQAPKLVGDDAEGGGNIFELGYFHDRKAYLATSPQLYKQILVGVFERVFSVGTVFRAEKHATTRHMSEYVSMDIEFGFIQDHLDIMRLETKFMRFLVTQLESTCTKELRILGMQLPKMPSEGDLFPHMKLREAQLLIKEKTGNDKTNEPDLEPEDERWLCEYAHAELNSDFIFITHYPVSKRPFYTYEDENDPGYTKSFDLLFRGVEITTGGQRIHNPDIMREKIIAKGLDPSNFEFYLQSFNFGMPPHGGWGMGLERLTAKIAGVANVKEATLFPRDINRIDTLLSKEDIHEDNNNE